MPATEFRRRSAPHRRRHYFAAATLRNAMTLMMLFLLHFDMIDISALDYELSFDD